MQELAGKKRKIPAYLSIISSNCPARCTFCNEKSRTPPSSIFRCPRLKPFPLYRIHKKAVPNLAGLPDSKGRGERL